MKDEAGPILTDEIREEIVKRIAEGLTPMEPRILLDAVLDLSGGLDDSAELLFAVSAALQDQSDELNRVFDGVEDAFTQHIAGSDDTYDPTDPEGATDILFAGIRAALDAHVAAFEADLGAFVAAESEALTTFLNNALQTEFGAGVGTLELEQNVLGFPLPISDAEVLFTAENLADRAGFGGDVVNQVGGSLGAEDQARLGDFLAGSFLDYAASQGEDIFTIDIADGQVGAAQYSVQQGADNSEILLSASAGDLRLNPDSFLGFFVADDPNETFRVFVQNFDFDGVITVDANGDDYSLIGDGFDIQEFTIGGFAINEDPNAIGFEQEGADGTAFSGGDSFVGAVYAFDTAELRFQASGFGDLTTTAQQNLAAGLGFASSTSTQLGFSTDIREADFSERTSTEGDFVAVVPGQEYILADYNFRQDFFPINVSSTFEPVLQPTAPVAFDTTVNRLVGSGGTGFDGLSSGNAADDVADPGFVLAGLDYILEAADEAIDFALDGLNLPIIGENLALGFTIFDDLRLDILSRAEAKTVNDDGTPVTTVDVLTGFMNDELNLLLGTSGETYIEAALGGFENTKPNFLQGNLQFSTEVFRAEIVDAFELGLDIPGLDFDFGNDNPIELISTANMNIGFGVDADGFFLLNDTNLSEISLDFRVAANDFEGNATIGGLLDITALAVDAPDRLPILEFPDTPDADGGDLSLTASLEVDLYGEAGRSVNPRVFDLIDVTKQLGNDEVDVRYEKQVRIAELQTVRNVGGSIAEVDVTGAADINIQLIGDILNPETGERIGAIPRFVTELVVDASFSGLEGGLPKLDKVFFSDLRVDAEGLYDNLIAPVIDPLVPFLDPLSTLADVLDVFPVSLVLDEVSDAFPLLNIFSALDGLETAANGLEDLFELTGGFVPFGDFDVLNDRFIPLGINTLPTIPRLGETGLIIDLPILTDATNLISLLKGDFEEVELVTASVVAVDIPEIEIDFLDTIFDAVDDLPLGGDVIGELLDGLLGLAGADAELGLEAFFGFTSGYDLSGVVNFVNTQDPTRLLDSFFLETEDVLVVDLDASANIGFDAFEVGTGAEAEITASAFGTSDVDIIDPNGDGKLRLNELAFLLGNASGSLDNFSDLFGSIFEGSLSFGFDIDIEGQVGIAGVTTGVDETILSFSESFGTPGEIHFCN